jgi:hypothetical protein
VNTILRAVCLAGALLTWPSITAAQAGDADPAALVQLAGDDVGSGTCGDYLVSWDNKRSFEVTAPGSATLRATTPYGQTAFDLTRRLAPGERIIPLWCGDLLGDGTQALGYAAYSGGAHCCFTSTIVNLDAGGQPILDADFGNGGLNMPQQLDGGGPLELPAQCDVLAYFDDLSYAASPSLPMVYAYDGTSYVEATRHFPDRLESEIDTAQADLADAVARPIPADAPPAVAYQEQESVALRLFGLHVLLGDADQALPAIQTNVAPPVAEWLAANAPAASDAIAARYNLADPQ